MPSLFDRPTFREEHELNVIIEAPRGSRNQYAYARARVDRAKGKKPKTRKKR